ncbi:MAG: XRE family transcriptional regulator [Alphaproteobacteria bacterium]|nr:XRE family transcriptional regulator [Alphaproteobacteria bacterium]
MNSESRAGARKRSKRPNKHIGSSFDEFLREEGLLEEFQAKAIKEVIAWQLEQAMKARKLSKRKLALLMRTSRTQVDRVLDPEDGNVTLETLQRAAAVVGRKVRFELA